MKKLAFLVAAAALTLSACSGSGDSGEKPEDASKLTVQATDAVTTAAISSGVTYVDFTNGSKKPVATLWFALDKNPKQGVANITACKDEWTSKGECKAGEQVVLPSVDLPGWQMPLATGATALSAGETTHLKFELKDVDTAVKFTVSAQAPKDLPAPEAKNKKKP